MNKSITLMGHNGAGKTTLMYYITGLLPNEKSHPFIKNFKDKIEPLDNDKISYVPEISYLEGSLNALDYFNLYKKIKKDTNITLDEILKKVNLNINKKSPIKGFSKGMKQRLLIGLSLIGDPEIIILDEPFSGLDIFGKKIITDLIHELNQTKTLIVSIHDIKFANDLNNEIWIIKEGEIVYQGNTENEEEIYDIFAKNIPKKIT